MSLQKEIYCRTLGCKLGFAVKGILRLFRKRLNQQEVELTVEQYFILNILDNKEGLILQDLSEILERDKSAVLRHINSLEENHFIARASDPDDKRRKILLITKPGLEELKKARQVDEQVDKEVTEEISDEKLKEFENLISDIYTKTISEQCS